ncbi:hypothetical protein AERO9AM_50092 [Aeromicrobium sp. 9AM]|nr:hypothetical protein AERO9AM_50092 [Aeromicrobium sp. 9AM]
MRTPPRGLFERADVTGPSSPDVWWTKPARP